MELAKRMFTRQIIERRPSKAIVAGWVEEIRVIGKLVFVVLRDREGKIQIVAPKDKVSQGVFEELSNLTKESVIAVSGEVIQNPEAPFGVELLPKEVVVLGRAESPLPLEFLKVDSSLDKRLDYRFLDLRHPKHLLIFKLGSYLESEIRKFFLKQGFIEVHTPKLVAAATEGGANLFKVEYFERDAYLAQSPQLYKQMLVIAGFERVFEISQVYRAEPHHTTKHLCEYTSIDFELGFIDGVNNVIEVVERCVGNALRKAMKTPEFKEFGVQLLLPKRFPRITYREAYRFMKEIGKKFEWGKEIGSENEIELWKKIREEKKSDLYFLTEFPWEERPFYTMRLQDAPEFTTGFDLIFKGMEIVTGSQREHRYEILLQQLKEKGLNPDSFQFYLTAFKYGAPPHGGAAIGSERLLMQVLELKNIRETTIFPRDPKRISP
ncbi:MAG: aspartate--tRNA(Asn) ligase [Candidatus Nanoarchaeia archaeon]|nr:aspartate--tRNA(Asn) ligase [Candidatus Haiyanarchaeum thermophilum]MCW1303389.1 aspartate--tRNA(Asn) ligase [Candidatus Haiyanarchaeum thermophilum]MCW1303923.1 aspartate--tRNA(Asn) ligase [Candidatus Haiyanarchaeum thermophilum]MCW1306751.1 aspartate--tRNA(Asn) ligase [Candidatus Haiyanarchaeum thermophilum]MCW1307416.1 aspartate--tRNA(Asn) ligase [Candidatus Haiyanarchaeum thermophilum]